MGSVVVVFLRKKTSADVCWRTEHRADIYEIIFMRPALSNAQRAHRQRVDKYAHSFRDQIKERERNNEEIDE